MTRLAVALTASTFAAVPVAAQDMYRGYETPRYTVTSREGTFEVRQYAPSLMAEVTIRTEQSRALRQGFGILAGYIFGGNASADKVAMTSPVSQTGEDGLWKVSFMMPREYTQNSLPVPHNAAIQFVQTAPEYYVVVRFSGWTTPKTFAGQEAGLRSFAASQQLELQGPALYHYYDDPMTLPWRRRNEVAFLIRQPADLQE